MKPLKSHTKAYEFIGVTTEIIKSKDRSQIGSKGKIIDETQNLFIIEPNRRILKKGVIFRMDMGSNKIDIDGTHLVGRSYDRIKKVLR